MDTREKLIRTAEKLMLRDGYSAMRVDEVIAKAGLSKGSFYHFFDSKEALALAALEGYYTDRVGRLAAGAYAKQSDPLRRAHGFLAHAQAVAGDLWAEGCLLASFAADAAGSSRVVAQALRKHTERLRGMLAELLAPFATPEITPAELADQFLVCVEGSIVMARIHGDPDYLRRGIEHFCRGLDRHVPAKPRAKPVARPRR